MADIRILAPFILSWEGGFANHPNDRGGATNKGVTLATWRSVGEDLDGDGDIDVDDLKLLTDDDVVTKVLKPYYWDKIKGDQIRNQGIANILADWAWMSGPRTPIREVQKLVGADCDGIMGPKTLSLINGSTYYDLFLWIIYERLHFYESLVKKNPSQNVFLNGWKRRLYAMRFTELHCNGGNIIGW